MLSAIQPRAIRLYRIEQQRALGTILHRVRNHRNWVARLVRQPIPALTDHEVDARSLDIPRSGSGGVLRVRSNRDDDVAVRVLPAILLHDALIRNVLGHIEHRAGMVGEARTSRKEQDCRHRHQTQYCSPHLHLSSRRHVRALRARLAGVSRRDACIITLTLVWRNWQTRRTQNPVAARPCGFDSLHQHHDSWLSPSDDPLPVRDLLPVFNPRQRDHDKVEHRQHNHRRRMR